MLIYRVYNVYFLMFGFRKSVNESGVYRIWEFIFVDGFIRV